MKNIVIKNICALSIIITCSIFTCVQAQVSLSLADNYAKMHEEKTTAQNTKEDIKKWLKSCITKNAPVKNNMINKILENGLFDEMHAERRNLNNILLVVPLKSVYFSQYIDKSKPLPLQYLLVIENEKGQIEEGNLMLVYPEDKSIKQLPKNAFRNFYSQENATDGTYSFITLYMGDSKSWEMDIKDGKRVQLRSYPGKKVATSTGTCRDWSLKTTDINKDGTTTTTLKSLGVSCTTCPPGYKCDPLSAIKIVSP